MSNVRDYSGNFPTSRRATSYRTYRSEQVYICTCTCYVCIGSSHVFRVESVEQSVCVSRVSHHQFDWLSQKNNKQGTQLGTGNPTYCIQQTS